MSVTFCLIVNITILHPGTNCCYLEQLSNIPKYQHQFLPRTSDMVINTVSNASSMLSLGGAL